MVLGIPSTGNGAPLTRKKIRLVRTLVSSAPLLVEGIQRRNTMRRSLTVEASTDLPQYHRPFLCV